MKNLITANRVIEISFTNGETNDVSLIKTSIVSACQLRWIKPVLGNELWDLIESEGDALSSHNKILIGKIEIPLAFFIKHELVPDMSINTTSSGLQVLRTEYSQPATDTQRGQIQDQALTHAESLLNEVVRWIEKEDNIINYPTYKDVNTVSSISNRGGIVL